MFGKKKPLIFLVLDLGSKSIKLEMILIWYGIELGEVVMWWKEIRNGDYVVEDSCQDA